MTENQPTLQAISFIHCPYFHNALDKGNENSHYRNIVALIINIISISNRE